jgi:DNA helicase INO80
MEGADPAPTAQEYHQTEEERHLASSDLSDCEDVWIADLSDYIIETHLRQRKVESWFDASVLVSLRPRSPSACSPFHRNATLTQR